MWFITHGGYLLKRHVYMVKGRRTDKKETAALKIKAAEIE